MGEEVEEAKFNRNGVIELNRLLTVELGFDLPLPLEDRAMIVNVLRSTMAFLFQPSGISLQMEVGEKEGDWAYLRLLGPRLEEAVQHAQQYKSLAEQLWFLLPARMKLFVLFRRDYGGTHQRTFLHQFFRDDDEGPRHREELSQILVESIANLRKYYGKTEEIPQLLIDVIPMMFFKRFADLPAPFNQPQGGVSVDVLRHLLQRDFTWQQMDPRMKQQASALFPYQPSRFKNAKQLLQIYNEFCSNASRAFMEGIHLAMAAALSASRYLVTRETTIQVWANGQEILFIDFPFEFPDPFGLPTGRRHFRLFQGDRHIAALKEAAGNDASFNRLIESAKAFARAYPNGVDDVIFENEVMIDFFTALQKYICPSLEMVVQCPLLPKAASFHSNAPMYTFFAGQFNAAKYHTLKVRIDQTNAYVPEYSVGSDPASKSIQGLTFDRFTVVEGKIVFVEEDRRGSDDDDDDYEPMYDPKDIGRRKQ